jgi:hypothetical protein
MFNRKQANDLLLEYLKNYLERYPDVRFSQALFNAGFVERKVAQWDRCKFTVWKDDYNLESVDLLDRVEEVFERGQNE